MDAMPGSAVGRVGSRQCRPHRYDAKHKVSPMTGSVAGAALAIVNACAILGPAAAAGAPKPENNIIPFEYVERYTAKYKPMYQDLREIELLEGLAKVLSQLKVRGGLVR